MIFWNLKRDFLTKAFTEENYREFLFDKRNVAFHSTRRLTTHCNGARNSRAYFHKTGGRTSTMQIHCQVALVHPVMTLPRRRQPSCLNVTFQLMDRQS